MRWARIALSAAVLSGLSGVWVLAASLPSGATGSVASARPLMTLTSQTQWVTPAEPGYSLDLAVAPGAGAAAGLHVSVTIYSRINDPSQLQEAIDATPDNHILARLPDIGLTSTPTGLTAGTCVTVTTESPANPPAAGASGNCTAGAPTVELPCVLGGGLCDDVYPVSVALERSGASTPLTRFTTFLTYEEPGVAVAPNTGGPLRVSWIVPVKSRLDGTSSAAEAAAENTGDLVADLWAHRTVPVTLAVSPTTAADLVALGSRRPLNQLAGLTAPSGPDQLLGQPYAQIDVAALAGAGLGSEIPLQLERGNQLLRAAALDPSGGTWVETDGHLASADLSSLSDGLDAVGADHVVVEGTALMSSQSQYTFAHPFTLALAHGRQVDAVAADGQLDSRFEADQADPALAANQLLAGLAFIHFENEFLSDTRGVVLAPPAGWRPSDTFVSTLLAGLANSEILSPVTLDQLFGQVSPGGNGDPTTRRLQSGPGVGNGGIAASTAARVLTYRDRLNSLGAAASGHPAVLASLSDQLLATEGSGLTRSARSSALTAYGGGFDTLLSSISLAVERTITFTSRTAPIPITVLSHAPFKVRVVLSLSSDKFTFPDGASRRLELSHATTSVRVEARARTSGDRLPVDVTLRTPDGALVISRTVLTVHSTEISIVAIALTVLAGLVLLVWWARTWRRGRRHRTRAH
jgi:hypothetical protein